MAVLDKMPRRGRIWLGTGLIISIVVLASVAVGVALATDPHRRLLAETQDAEGDPASIEADPAGPQTPPGTATVTDSDLPAGDDDTGDDDDDGGGGGGGSGGSGEPPTNKNEALEGPGSPAAITAPGPPAVGTPVDGWTLEKSWTPDLAAEQKYDYQKLLGLAIKFYESMRSGMLSEASVGNRLKWRGDQLLDDGSDIKADLAGGHYEAGNRLKVTMMSGYFTARLAVACLMHRDTLEKIVFEGQSMYYWCKREVRWGADWLLKAHLFTGDTRPETWRTGDRLVVMVGKRKQDFQCYNRAENIPVEPDCPASYRTSVVADDTNGASDAAANAAAALAGAAAMWTDEPTFSRDAIYSAHALQDFAERYTPTAAQLDAEIFKIYPSTNGEQHTFWSASVLAWVHSCTSGSPLCNATLSDNYYAAAQGLWTNPEVESRKFYFVSIWDNPVFDGAILMNFLSATPEEAQPYQQVLGQYVDSYIDAGGFIQVSPKGLRRTETQTWAPLRLASFSAYTSLTYALMDGVSAEVATKARCLALSQINYIAGDTGFCFVVNGSDTLPWAKQVHHRDASCTMKEDETAGLCRENWGAKRDNPHSVEGAIVGGPDPADNFIDDRGKYEYTEVALDYNSGFAWALTSLLTVPPDFWSVDCSAEIPNYPWDGGKLPGVTALAPAPAR